MIVCNNYKENKYLLIKFSHMYTEITKSILSRMENIRKCAKEKLYLTHKASFIKKKRKKYFCTIFLLINQVNKTFHRPVKKILNMCGTKWTHK